jgi:hypothetical protein
MKRKGEHVAMRLEKNVEEGSEIFGSESLLPDSSWDVERDRELTLICRDQVHLVGATLASRVHLSESSPS